MKLSNRILGLAIIATSLLCFAMRQPLAGTVVLFCAPACLALAQPQLGITGIVFDVQLTNFAHGIAPDFSSALADLMAPQCVAPAAYGHYIAFDDDEAFRYIDTRRAIGGDMALIDIPTTSPRFDCSPHALGIATDSFEYERVGEAGLPMLRESKIRTLISRNALSREKRVFDTYTNGTTAESGLGVWTNAAVDPIQELDGIIADLATQTGNANIHLVIGLPAMKQLRAHPLVKKYFPGAPLISITPATIAQMLIIPVTIHVAMMPIALEKTGKTASKVTIAGSKVYALITQDNPSPFDPSAAKTFTTRLGQVEGVGVTPRPPFAEINFVAWSEDIRITGSKCVKRIDVATGPIS